MGRMGGDVAFGEVPYSRLLSSMTHMRLTACSHHADRVVERCVGRDPATVPRASSPHVQWSAGRVVLIRLCEDAGFTLLAEIGRPLAAERFGRRAWDHLAERKIAELDARTADAQRPKHPIGHALEARPIVRHASATT
jgi:hypothetical protein